MAGSQEPDQRTGIFTTGSIAQLGPLSVALYFTGQNHAGENLNQLLKRRAADLAQRSQMGAALSRYELLEFYSIPCNCILPVRRDFSDLREGFPEAGRHVSESRRHFHQAQSKPVMDQLRQWLPAQLDQERVEVNSL